MLLLQHKLSGASDLELNRLADHMAHSSSTQKQWYSPYDKRVEAVGVSKGISDRFKKLNMAGETSTATTDVAAANVRENYTIDVKYKHLFHAI